MFIAVVGGNVGLLDGTLVSRRERSASSPGDDGLLVGSTCLEHVANKLPPGIAVLACSLEAIWVRNTRLGENRGDLAS